MKLITFALPDGARHIGALRADDTSLVDFTASDPSPMLRDMLALIDGGEPALDLARDLARGGRPGSVTRTLADVQLLAPLPEPRQMRDFLCFETHFRQARTKRHLFGISGFPRDPAAIELPAVWYEEPIYYKCNRFAVIGTGADIVMPGYTRMLDYELEFGVVLGKRGKNIPLEEADEHIFGYCIFNDVSARDQQMREMQGLLGPTKGKDFDTANVLGPWLVTADEVPEPYALKMIARVNGKEWSRGTSAGMRHDFRRIIEHVSRDETVYPGEFFGSGTVGNGCGLELERFLQPGDVVELEVQGLGVLRNRVVTGAPS